MPSFCLCTPSKGRPEYFVKKTYQVLKYCSNWRVFVEPQDYDSYAAQGIPEDNIVNIGKDNEGLAYSLTCIKHWCIENDVEFAMKIDDDIQHFYDPDHLLVCPKRTQARFLEKRIKNLLDVTVDILGDDLSAIGASPKLFYKNYNKFTHVNKKLEGQYLIRAKDWYAPHQSRGFDEESWLSAQLYLKGKITLRTGQLAFQNNCSTLAGGLQSFDRRKETELAFRRMKKANPAAHAMLPTRESTYSDGSCFKTVFTKEYNKKYAHRLPVKAGVFSADLERKLNTLAEMK